MNWDVLDLALRELRSQPEKEEVKRSEAKEHSSRRPTRKGKSPYSVAAGSVWFDERDPP